MYLVRCLVHLLDRTQRKRNHTKGLSISQSDRNHRNNSNQLALSINIIHHQSFCGLLSLPQCSSLLFLDLTSRFQSTNNTHMHSSMFIYVSTSLFHLITMFFPFSSTVVYWHTPPSHSSLSLLRIMWFSAAVAMVTILISQECNRVWFILSLLPFPTILPHPPPQHHPSFSYSSISSYICHLYDLTQYTQFTISKVGVITLNLQYVDSRGHVLPMHLAAHTLFPPLSLQCFLTFPPAL